MYVRILIDYSASPSISAAAILSLLLIPCLLLGLTTVFCCWYKLTMSQGQNGGEEMNPPTHPQISNAAADEKLCDS